MTKNREDYYVFVHGQDGVGDFDLFINEDVNLGFGTIAPTTTPGKFGKDLFRWIPINNNIVIVTDYPSLTIVVPPNAGGTANVKGNAIKYSSPLDYIGADVIAVEGCIQGDCYRFDITVKIMGNEEDVGVGGKNGGGDDDEDGWNKLWLLLLLLLIPCVCFPLFYFIYQKKKKTEEENEYENEYENADNEDRDFKDVFEVFEDDIEDGRLLPGNDDSSDDDDGDWESRDDDEDDDDEDEDEYESDDSSEDENQSSSEEEESDGYEDDTGFDDEYKKSR